MANQYTLGQAVQFFAAEHKGFGQVLTRGYATGIHPRRPDSYAYALWPKSFEILSLMGNVLAPWPIAYSSYIGAPGLRTEKLLLALPFPRPVDPQRLTGKAQVDVLQCPSDRDLIGELLSPTSRLYGAISYGINEDVFLQDHSANPRFVGEPPRNVWKNGGWNGVPLQGRLDRVRCPSSVLMFLDFGGVDNYSGWHPNLAFSSGAGGGATLTHLANVNAHGLPFRRHGAGGLVGVHVDGHAEYFRATNTILAAGQRVPTKVFTEPANHPV